MFDKDHAKKILRLNGLSEGSADDDIRSVLMYAKCQDVDGAISALRDDTIGPHGDVCGLQHSSTRCNVLLADKRLRPETVKELLGIDMQMTFEDIEDMRARRRSISLGQICSIVGWSVACASISVLALMWYYGIGVFHPTA